jgi:aminoglycoside 6'-N-acetyltransferase I
MASFSVHPLRQKAIFLMNPTLSIVVGLPLHLPLWLPLRTQLWPEETEENHLQEMQEILDSTETDVLLAMLDKQVVGFAEVSLRPWASGCTTKPVGYLEGIFVVEKVRQTGVGAALLRKAENWTRQQGCKEMASDVLLDNHVSHDFHKRCGFQEVERVVTYARKL